MSSLGINHVLYLFAVVLSEIAFTSLLIIRSYFPDSVSPALEASFAAPLCTPPHRFQSCQKEYRYVASASLLCKHLVNELLQVTPQRLRPLQCREMSTFLMFSPIYQLLICCTLDPVSWDRCNLVREPTKSKRLIDPPNWILMRTYVAWCEELAVRIDCFRESIGQVIKGHRFQDCVERWSASWV